MSGVHAIVCATGITLRLQADTVDDINPGTPSTSSWRIGSDGGIYWSRTTVSGGAFLKQYNWVLPNSEASNYECTWDAGTGTVDTTPGSAGTWLACTSNRTWTETNATTSEEATFTARIRHVGGTSETTATITLSVDASP